MNKGAGIIAVKLVDPFSSLISRIKNIDSTNAIGFYYDKRVILYNICDNDFVPWLKLGCSVDTLLGSPLAVKIVYYPIVDHMVKRFIQTVTSVMLENVRSVVDKCTSYTNMLLQMVGLPFVENKNGYSVVNQVLLSIDRVRTVGITNINKGIISSPWLSVENVITAPKNEISSDLNKTIIAESKQNIAMIAASFIDLWTMNNEFAAIVSDLKNLPALFDAENKLVKTIQYFLDQGNLNLEELNSVIDELSNARKQIGCSSELVSLKTENEMIMINKSETLNALGVKIHEISSKLTLNQPVIINWGELIKNYNSVAKLCGADLLPYPIHQVSKTCIIASNAEMVSVPQTNIIVSVNDPDLTNLNNNQLKSLLIYIDSLRGPDGSGLDKFVELKNSIVVKLAMMK